MDCGSQLDLYDPATAKAMAPQSAEEREEFVWKETVYNKN
jgi:hypothetical protein